MPRRFRVWDGDSMWYPGDDDWADGGAGILTYSGGETGTVTYTSVVGPPSTYDIVSVYGTSTL